MKDNENEIEIRIQERTKKEQNSRRDKMTIDVVFKFVKVCSYQESK